MPSSRQPNQALPRKKVTLRQVADRSGFSIFTVSRILNSHDEANLPFREETIRRIREVAETLGYYPDRFAQSLRLGRSHLLGLSVQFASPETAETTGSAMLLNELYGTFGAQVIGAGSEAELRGYHLVVLDRKERDHNVLQEQTLFPDLLDGLLYLTPTERHTEYVEVFRYKPNMVLIGHCPKQSELPSCDIDNELLGETLARAVLTRGSRRPLVLLPVSPEYALVQDRLAGARRALSRAGIELTEGQIFYEYFEPSHVPERLGEFFSKNSGFDGVIAAGLDRCTEVMIRVLEQRGQAVPGEIQVSALSHMPLSVIEQRGIPYIPIPFQKMAREATRLLIDLIEGRPLESRHRVIPVELVDPLVLA